MSKFIIYNTPKPIKGGGIPAGDMQRLLKQSYTDGGLEDIDDYKVDTKLSGQRVQVYQHEPTKKAVVVHRGTKGSADVLTDLGLAVGYRGNRFDHGLKVQKEAEAKYGNVITLGHSLGAKIAEETAGKDSEIITLNKPTLPNEILFGRRLFGNKNQTDVKSSLDPVSVLKLSGKRDIVIPSKTRNPLKEHSTDVLGRLDSTQIIGKKTETETGFIIPSKTRKPIKKVPSERLIRLKL
jgi:hypothetical protein